VALSIDWLTKVITVPKADTTLIQSNPIEIRELNLDTFRLNLKAIEDSEEGMPFLDTHQHNTTVTVGGVTLARVVEIINGYTVTFEDGAYRVNLVGANSNVADVLNLNTVQVAANNSAGLIQTIGATSAPTVGQIATELLDTQTVDGFTRRQLEALIAAVLLGKVSGAGTDTEVFTAADGSKVRVTATVDENGNRTAIVTNVTDPS
jgi:hypothetical protein